MKKRITAFLMALCLMLSPAGALAAQIVLGDADGSGSVDHADAMTVMQYFTGLSAEAALDVTAADVDSSGTVDFFDAMYILQHYAGIIEKLPGEPEATEPEETVPEVTEPEETEPEVTEPVETEPEETVPEETEPEVTEPEVTEPEVTEPVETEPEETVSEETIPEETEPEVTEPEETEPEETEPEETEPEETEPEETEPEGTEPEAEVIDLTDKLNALMRKNAATMRSVRSRYGKYLAAVYFYEKVKDGGDWDIKLQDEWKFQEGKTYVYRGREMRWDDPGNIHFGYVGAVVFPEEVVCAGAGINQVTKFGFSFGDFTTYYDDPRDQEMMRWGYRLYEEEN